MLIFGFYNFFLSLLTTEDAWCCNIIFKCLTEYNKPREITTVVRVLPHPNIYRIYFSLINFEIISYNMIIQKYKWLTQNSKQKKKAFLLLKAPFALHSF